MSLYETSTQDHQDYLNTRRESLKIEALNKEIQRLNALVDSQKHVLTVQTRLLARIQCEAKKILTGEQTPTGFLTFLEQKPDIEL